MKYKTKLSGIKTTFLMPAVVSLFAVQACDSDVVSPEGEIDVSVSITDNTDDSGTDPVPPSPVNPSGDTPPAGESLAALDPATNPDSDVIFYSLDGTGNNPELPAQGSVGTNYSRVAPAAYADGIGEMVPGPEMRFISNRIFADGAQNLFSENGVTQWAYNWGQFIDHTFGLREIDGDPAEVLFDGNDPLENFSNSAQNLSMTRSAVAAGTGETVAREHVNTVSSFVDGWAVYGGTEDRLEWLREGPVDGDLTNNSATLLLTETGHLPPASFRGDASTAPEMERGGMLAAIPNADDVVRIAGDKRANENIALQTAQTLFAREHNRIVGLLPDTFSEEFKFEIARQLVIATQQYITYNEFLPAVGVDLSEPNFDASIDTSISHEFATVGYRAHSMIHGEIELEVDSDAFSAEQLAGFAAQGIEVAAEGDDVEIAVPLNVAFFNPQLTEDIGIGFLAAGLGGEPQYSNDETFDNQLRSVLFQLPNPEVLNPDVCLDGPDLPTCFNLVSDLGVIDIFRGRDHGIPDYNSLREAFGLDRVESFTDITGEDTQEFSADIDAADPINDPAIMEYDQLLDVNGNSIPFESEGADGDAVLAVRRSTLAARLNAIYGGDVDSVDAFVGMVSEPHLPGSEFGELQHAMWKVQFEALRDGDANFYLWNPLVALIDSELGDVVNFRQTLAEVVVNNTELNAGDVQENLFFAQ